MKVFVINLDRDRRRLGRFRKVMDHLEVPFQRWAATSGEDIDPRKFSVTPLEPGIFISGFDEWSRNEAACGVSHIRLLRYIVSISLPWSIIMEDDAVLRRPISLDESAWALPADAEIVMLSDRAEIGPERVCGPSFSYGNVIGGAGTEAYLISLKGAKKLLTALYPLREPLDFQMYAHFESIQASDRAPYYWRLPLNPTAGHVLLKAYRIEPSLVVHPGDSSSIGNSRHPRAHFYCKVLLGLDYDEPSTTVSALSYSALREQKILADLPERTTPRPRAVNTIYWRGVDVSHWDRHLPYRSEPSAQTASLFALLRDHGINTVRISLWVDSNTSFNLDRGLAVAEEAARNGLQTCLVLHYSDTWTNPGQQQKPREWRSLGVDELGRQLRKYTRDVLTAFATQGTAPAIVQPGNEITNGFLWAEEGESHCRGGRITGSSDSDWQPFVGLLRNAIFGIRESAGITGESPRVMLHFDNGASAHSVVSWFGRMDRYGIDYDAVGVSLHDLRHPANMVACLRELDFVAGYCRGKEVIIAETSHPYRPFFGSTGAVEAGDPPYSANGQQEFLRHALAAVRELPNTTGLFWWGATFVNDALDHCPDAFQARALFDARGVALPALKAFKSVQYTNTKHLRLSGRDPSAALRSPHRLVSRP